MLERYLMECSNAQGGMERIKNTPMPQQYATYPVLFTHLFCGLLPVGLVGTLGLYTPLGSTIIGFLLLTLLQIGDDMQRPFDHTHNDVPLSTITRTIEIDLREGLEETHDLVALPNIGGVAW